MPHHGFLRHQLELPQQQQNVTITAMSQHIKVSESLASVDSENGRQRLAAYLKSQPFPHYEPHPKSPGLLVRIDQDGRRTVGRFVGREFRAAN